MKPYLLILLAVVDVFVSLMLWGMVFTPPPINQTFNIESYYHGATLMAIILSLNAVAVFDYCLASIQFEV